jgi:hypothetical protein
MSERRCPLALLLTVSLAACAGAADRDASIGGDAAVLDGEPDENRGDPDVSGPPDDGAVLPPGARSYVVEGKLTLRPVLATNPGIVYTPDHHDFVLHLDPAAGALAIGNAGWATRVAVTTRDGFTYQATEPVSVPISPATACGSSAVYNRFTVTVGPGGLTGLAEGRIEVTMGDVRFPFDGTLTMTGKDDTVGPTFGPDRVDVDPLAPLSLIASEPLGEVSGRLTAGGEVLVLTPILAARVLTIGFEKPAPDALRYGTSYELGVAPGPTDLAGNPAGPPTKVVTVAAPPLIPEDGFETAGSTVGGARVIDASVLPPVSGTRSVLLGPRTTALPGLLPPGALTVRLAVSPGDRVVRVALRPLGWNQVFASTYAVVQIAVPGGRIARLALPPTETVTTPATVEGRTVYLGDARTAELTLPFGVEGEIVFQARTDAAPADCGLLPPTAGYLIDDLRVE